MELSILQHPKDNNPRTVSIGEVADMISEEGDSGYLAVRRTVEEIQSLGVQMAYNARRAAKDEPF